VTATPPLFWEVSPLFGGEYLPRKKKKEEVIPEQPASPETMLQPLQTEESDIDKAPLDTSLELIKVKVKTGTLAYEEGTFQKGDVFYVSKKRAALFDPNDIQVLE